MQIERLGIPVSGGLRLEGVVAWPARPKALAIAVPLVGGTATQQIRLFRTLLRGGTGLASFTFRGHPRSEGTFSFAATLTDTAEAVERVMARAAERGVPVHLLGASYATIPLVLAVSRHAEWAIRSFVAVSGFPGLEDLLALFGPFLAGYARITGRGTTPEDLVRAVAADAAALDQALFRAALRDYLAHRFPSISVSSERFEVLEYRRVNLVNEVLAYGHFLLEARRGASTDLPSLWIYARGDDVLDLAGEEARERYRRRVLSVAPKAVFYEADVDHWANGPDHDLVLARTAAFIREH